MAKIDLLSAAKVRTLKAPGDYLDGRGLYLQVRSKSSKSWLLKYSIEKRAREMGLGPAADIPLATARELRDRHRALLKQGIDPLEHKEAEKSAKALERAKAITFKDACARYIAANRAGWKNIKHAAQWEATLKAYAYPIIGALPVQAIDTALVMAVLDPIWSTKPETASRVRGRIESVISAAKARGEFKGENPATWKGHLDNLLPKTSKVRKVENHAALPYADLPAFIMDLRQREGIAAAAMEFLILTAARTGEVLGATWDELDLRKSVWTIPGERMKNGKEHQVPLSPPAVAVLERMSKLTNGEFVFFGQSSGRSLSNMALLVLLRRMKRTDITSHGFRSTFRDWAAERGYQDPVAEAALAHSVPDAVVAAYKRTTFFEMRKKMMDDWAAFATSDPTQSADVLPFAPVTTANLRAGP
jgi:integrase